MLSQIVPRDRWSVQVPRPIQSVSIRGTLHEISGQVEALRLGRRTRPIRRSIADLKVLSGGLIRGWDGPGRLHRVSVGEQCLHARWF